MCHSCERRYPNGNAWEPSGAAREEEAFPYQLRGKVTSWETIANEERALIQHSKVQYFSEEGPDGKDHDHRSLQAEHRPVRGVSERR